MADNFQSGHLAKIGFTVAGGLEIAIKVRGWDENDTVLTHLVTHTGTAGLVARFAGVRDIIVSFRGMVDIDAYLHAASPAPAVVPGNRGTLKVYRNATKFKSFGVVVKGVRDTAAVEGMVEFTVDMEMTTIIDTTGTYIAITEEV